jgi:hypothetical protein
MPFLFILKISLMLMVMVLMMMVTIILEQAMDGKRICYYGINFFRFLPSNTVSNFHCKYSANKLNTGTIKTEIALTPGLLMTMILI